MTNFTFEIRDSSNNALINAVNGSGTDVIWGFDVETYLNDEYRFDIDPNFKKLTIKAIAFQSDTGANWKLRRRIGVSTVHIFHNIGPINEVEPIFLYNELVGGVKAITCFSYSSFGGSVVRDFPETNNINQVRFVHQLNVALEITEEL
jgi:hypothetical protein